MVLCDVSGSVAAMAQFLLMFLYALHEALADIRGFAFTSSTDRGQRHPGGGADRGGDRQDHADDRLSGHRTMATRWRISRTVGGVVTSKTTLIILGDARGNRTDPRIDVFQAIAARAKRVIWLNPEYRSGLGDRRFGHVPVCAALPAGAGLFHLARSGTGGNRSTGDDILNAALGHEEWRAATTSTTAQLREWPRDQRAGVGKEACREKSVPRALCVNSRRRVEPG